MVFNYGNYVIIDNPKHHPDLKDKVMVVCGFEKLREDENVIIKLNHINYIDNIVLPFASQFEKFIKPIPLTKEWLLKFGFEKIVDTSEFGQYYEFELSFDGFDIEFHITGDIVDCYLESVGIDILYVHQLQSLYFVLTQKELTIK